MIGVLSCLVSVLYFLIVLVIMMLLFEMIIGNFVCVIRLVVLFRFCLLLGL